MQSEQLQQGVKEYSNTKVERTDPISVGERIFAERSNSGVIAHELKEVINEKSSELLIQINGNSNQEVTQSLFRPVKYPKESTSQAVLNSESINASVDEYLQWRRSNDEKGGVLEPNRAKVLGHSTSLAAVKEMLADGNLRSIDSLIVSDNPRMDLMQGGKAQHIARSTRELIESNTELQEYIYNNREELLDHFKNGFSKRLAQIAISDTKNFEELIKVFPKYAFDNASILNPAKARISFSESGVDMRYMANILPQNIREQIAKNSYAEKYVSFVLGHAIAGYTPDQNDPSVQAAFILNKDQYSTDQLYSGGGSNQYKKLSNEKLSGSIENFEKQKSTLLNAEYSETTLQISIMENKEVGTAIDIKKGVFLLPESKRKDFKSENNIIFFNDTKFKSVDEALGWLVTTPEGQALYSSKLESNTI